MYLLQTIFLKCRFRHRKVIILFHSFSNLHKKNRKKSLEILGLQETLIHINGNKRHKHKWIVILNHIPVNLLFIIV